MTLRDLEAEILRLHNEFCIRTSVAKARRIGEYLLEAKRQIKRGGFRSWLRRIGMKKTSANDYMRVAMAENVRPTGQLTIDGLLRILRAGQKAQRHERAKELARAANPPCLDPGIITGDCFDWLKTQKDNSIPFFLSDPPFGLGKCYDTWTEPDTPEDYWRWFKRYWFEMTRVVQKGGFVVLWQPYRNMRYFWDWFPGHDITVENCIVRGANVWEPVGTCLAPL